ncbi:transketolase family protein [Rhodococcoides yunnanense]|uniref:transketolase family protein n=1 Tax=Rhodococcoides yunnanense TaxID=278209 RepID=UPI000AB550D8|nr:hypothetical protein [Rhodococcus yunnanensis]
MTTFVGSEVDQRERFYRLMPELLAQDERLALVLAEIGAAYIEPHLTDAVRPRVVNVGIREQLMISLAGGMALAGMRPVVHTFPPFLVERPYEQVKLDLGHQGVGAILVSAGGSYSMAAGGQTHFGHRDVAVLDTLEGWTVHVPGTADEAEDALRRAARSEERTYIRLDGLSNRTRLSEGDGFTVLRTGTAGTVIAVGPTADRVLGALEQRDVTVLYADTIRPFDAATVTATLTRPDVALVEPYLVGTSTPFLADALAHVPHRILALGVGRTELRNTVRRRTTNVRTDSTPQASGILSTPSSEPVPVSIPKMRRLGTECPGQRTYDGLKQWPRCCSLGRVHPRSGDYENSNRTFVAREQGARRGFGNRTARSGQANLVQRGTFGVDRRGRRHRLAR